jgi:exodeoxyribonuclease VII large subunit
MQGLIVPRRAVLERRASELASVMCRAAHQRRERLGALAGQIDALSPLATLRRGYAVPLDSESQVLRSVTQFHPGDAFDLRVIDGRVRCDTIQVSQEAVD